jgi:hypothetical protein
MLLVVIAWVLGIGTIADGFVRMYGPSRTIAAGVVVWPLIIAATMIGAT